MSNLLFGGCNKLSICFSIRCHIIDCSVHLLKSKPASHVSVVLDLVLGSWLCITSEEWLFLSKKWIYWNWKDRRKQRSVSTFRLQIMIKPFSCQCSSQYFLNLSNNSYYCGTAIITMKAQSVFIKQFTDVLLTVLLCSIKLFSTCFLTKTNKYMQHVHVA